MRYGDDWDWRHYAPSRPLAAKGGIKAQTKRGAFGQSWWAQRWIKTLESFNIGARLGRGRSYARNGQVLNIDIGEGGVTADVQGSRPEPYEVAIAVRVIPPAGWKKVAEQLASQAVFAAKLLAGEMPHEIEEVFAAAKQSLFPRSVRDLATDCSCPDSSNPCKHIAAVYYLLGEEFDRDPFLIFRLRGMEREQFLAMLGPAAEIAETQAPPEPLEAAGFWNAPELPKGVAAEAEIPPQPAPLVRRLGKFPLWRGSEAVAEALAPVYARASERGLELAAGDLR